MIKDALAAPETATHCPLCGTPVAEAPLTEEHIFPQWLQRKHYLLNRRLTIPNLLEKPYKSVKIGICAKCNNETFSELEREIAPLLTAPSPFAATSPASLDFEHMALWLGKIIWLLARKSHSVEDYRDRASERPERIMPESLLPGLLYLGMFVRCFVAGKTMHACYLGDPPIPEYFYDAPYSLYRFEIDCRDDRCERFDFHDNLAFGGAALRSGDVGFICLFDGGLHRRFRSQCYAYLEGERLHPHQFNEVIGRFYYDQTVLDEEAGRVQYYWNDRLNAVVTQSQTPRSFDPYLQENHDPQRLATMLGFHTMQEPSEILGEDGSVFTMLQGPDGTFLRHAVTEEEIEAARHQAGIKLVRLVGPSIRKHI
jgi:hypothetical protein